MAPELIPEAPSSRRQRRSVVREFDSGEFGMEMQLMPPEPRRTLSTEEVVFGADIFKFPAPT